MVWVDIKTLEPGSILLVDAVCVVVFRAGYTIPMFVEIGVTTFGDLLGFFELSTNALTVELTPLLTEPLAAFSLSLLALFGLLPVVSGDSFIVLTSFMIS